MTYKVQIPQEWGWRKKIAGFPRIWGCAKQEYKKRKEYTDLQFTIEITG